MYQTRSGSVQLGPGSNTDLYELHDPTHFKTESVMEKVRGTLGIFFFFYN